MIEIFGISLGTPFQGGTLLALLVALGIWWVRGMPERHRAKNEGKVIDNTELARQYREWRAEVHDLKNDVAKVLAKQIKCDEALAEAHAVNRRNKDQTSTLMFIIRLLISELKRLDPESIIVRQAEETLAHMEPVENKQNPLAAAEATVKSAKATVDEVKNVGGGK